MKTMKILNKVLLLMLIMTTIGCSTDDIENYNTQSNNVEVENTIANKVIEETGVSCCINEMIFHESFNTYAVKAEIISYYSNNSGITITAYGSSLDSVSYTFTWDSDWDGNDLLIRQKFITDKRFTLMYDCSGPHDDGEDDGPVLW